MVVGGNGKKGPPRSPAFEEMLRAAAKSSRGDGARITIRRTEDGLGIHNPARRSIALVAFLSLWLIFWVAGIYFGAFAFADGTPLPVTVMLLVFLTLWVAGGLVVMAFIGWNIAGLERIFVISGVLATETGFGPFQIRRFFPVSTVTELKAASRGTALNPRRKSFGAISFKSDGKPHLIGFGLDKAERAAVLEALQAEFGGRADGVERYPVS